MKTTFKLGFILLGLLTIVSCTTFELGGMAYQTNTPTFDVLGSFDITVKVKEWVGSPAGINTFNISAENMNDPLRDAIQDEIQSLSGDAAINVRITYKATFTDFMASAFTLGIYTPATAVITGTVVSYN